MELYINKHDTDKDKLTFLRQKLLTMVYLSPSFCINKFNYIPLLLYFSLFNINRSESVINIDPAVFQADVSMVMEMKLL